MSRLTDKEWVDITRKTIENYNTGHLRLGQSYMNALGDINIDLYKEVTATEYDCFYNDDNNPNEGEPCHNFIDKCKNPLTGWLRWRQENKLLIDIFLMP
jgi:hypothetical protein